MANTYHGVVKTSDASTGEYVVTIGIRTLNPKIAPGERVAITVGPQSGIVPGATRLPDTAEAVNVGKGVIDIEPDFSDFQRKLELELASAFSRIASKVLASADKTTKTDFNGNPL
jgi:hypothetical protein